MTLSTNSYTDIVRDTERLTSVALQHLDDGNEARWLVHRVMLGAIAGMRTPPEPGALDTALALLLTEHSPRRLN